MPNAPQKENGTRTTSLVYALFLSVQNEGADLVGVFGSEARARDYMQALPTADIGASYVVEPMPLNPDTPHKAVDLRGYVEVTSTSTPTDYREYVNDQGVCIGVPYGVLTAGFDGG